MNVLLLFQFHFPGLIELGAKCFFQCSSLTSIVFPFSLSVLGKSSFENCVLLSSVSFTNLSIEVHPTAFLGCPPPPLSLIFFEEMKVESKFFEPSCPICKEDFGPELTPFVSKSCQHVFCQNCIEEFTQMSDKCPLCHQLFRPSNQ